MRPSPLGALTPSLPTNIIPAKNAWLKLSGKIPMDVRIPPLEIKIMLESNPLKSTMLVGRLAGPLREDPPSRKQQLQTPLLSIHVRVLLSFQQPTFQKIAIVINDSQTPSFVSIEIKKCRLILWFEIINCNSLYERSHEIMKFMKCHYVSETKWVDMCNWNYC